MLFPNSGGFVEEDELHRYRQVLQGNYRVIYRYDPTTDVATFITVIHAARLLDPDSLSDAGD
jgi:mRNA-degrading endonuclease RelE of RelBE toxin-antitoxin system